MYALIRINVRTKRWNDMTKTTNLRKIPLFRDLSGHHIDILTTCSQSRSFKAGDILWIRGENAGAFHVVQSGRIKIFRSSPEGKEQTMYLFGPGEPFCLCSGFDNDGTQPASAMALEPSIVLSIAWDCLSKATKHDPLLLQKIIQILSRRLKDAMDMVDSLSLREIPSRLALFLLQSCEPETGTVTFQVSQREIAKIIGTTPETLSRVLKRLVGEKIITTADKTITIIDKKKLLNLAGD